MRNRKPDRPAMKFKQTKPKGPVGEGLKEQGLSDQAWDLLGEAFGKIEDAQKSLEPLDAPLVKYLLDMTKLEIARTGTGLSFGAPGETESTDAWLKALRSEEDEEPADRHPRN